jgi:very-long-chain enoyl-CoA reductase
MQLSGPQIAWRTVFMVEYLGPLIMHPLFLFVLRPYIYSNSKFNPLSYLPFGITADGPLPPPSTTQVLMCLLITLHFLKREYETIFVHRFSSATMPAFNIFKNSAHYWILSGLNLAYFLYAPTSPAASWWPKALDAEKNPVVLYGAVALWVFSELANYSTHVTLRNLRPSDGSTKRQIPRGFGFDLVTCPNYLFESLAWLAIVILSGGNWASVLFLVVAAGQMAVWAKKKERRYRKEFGSAYKKKCAMIPGIW